MLSAAKAVKSGWARLSGWLPYAASASPSPSAGWKRANRTAALLIVVAGAIYVGLALSPSSYGYVLVNLLGSTESGPVWGRSRLIRSDELAVVTPLTQATVRNGFRRFNETSPYREDMRINYGLPLGDWGLVFKPTMWLYGLAEPAFAYSFHWYVLSALFVAGYALLFRWLGASAPIGYALAAGLYFTGFVQFWWNEKGSEFALFPWVLLPFATRLPLLVKAALFYWLACSWLISNFYPPVQISLAFVGLVILLARDPQLFRPARLAVLGVAALLAAATTAAYLRDYLQATATTLYPGGREIAGGGVPSRFWLSWLFPAINFDRGYQSRMAGWNICETGTVGLYYTLLVICFLDYKQWLRLRENAAARRMLIFLCAGLAMQCAWMALPLPSWAGALLLWNHVQPNRMQYAGGMLAILALFVLANTLGLRASRARLAAFSAIVLLGWMAWKFESGKNRHEDLIILLAAPLALYFVRNNGQRLHAALAVASLVAGMVLFGRFNPLQPAHPIFDAAIAARSGYLREIEAHNGGLLVVEGLPGAVANGLGYRSLGHVTATPHLEFWRARFPDLPPETVTRLFNRYAHIIPAAVSEPVLLSPDAVAIPTHRFQRTAAVEYVGMPEQADGTGGEISSVTLRARQMIVAGWGAWTGPLDAHALEVTMPEPWTAAPTRSLLIRPELPNRTGSARSALMGFRLAIPNATDALPDCLSVVARDAATGVRLMLRNPPGLRECGFAARPAHALAIGNGNK